MDWVETIQSSPNPRATDLNPVQSSWWPRIWIQSSPIRTQQNRYLPNTLQNRHVNTNDDVYSWRFEGKASDVRVTVRRNCLKSLNMGYALHISGSNPIQNPLSWWISDPVQSKSAWTGLDYESSGLIQPIPFSASDHWRIQGPTRPCPQKPKKGGHHFVAPPKKLLKSFFFTFFLSEFGFIPPK